jgi:hypothetical protein
MNPADIAQISQALCRQHPTIASGCDLADFERTLAMLPDQGEFKIAELTPAVFALAPGDALFTITVSPPEQHGGSCVVTLTSRTIDGHKLAARMEWGELVHTRDGESWRRTNWIFRYAGHADDELDEWQRVSGLVRVRPQPEEVDYNERYARALLARVGTRIAGGA